MKYILFSMILLVGCVATKAQTGYTTKKTTNAKAFGFYKKGADAANHREYDKAISYLEKSLKKDPKLIDAIIKIGGVYYEQDKFVVAKKYFNKALQIDPDYQPRLYYALAMIATKSDDFDGAIPLLERFLSYPKIKGRRRANAEKKMEIIRFSANAIRHPLPFAPKNMGPNINTSEPEYLPSFTADEQFFIYTRRVHNQEDFYISRKENGVFTVGEPMEQINTDKNEGAQCISSDGRFLAMTLCGRDQTAHGSCDIYFSRKENGHWTPIKNIGQKVNSKYWEAQPSLSANGDALYFASERPGGLGKRDIWVSYQLPNGAWGTPHNLGDSINTKGADQAPFIHPDGKTLYFMSDGHPGMGGSDLFVSRKQPDGTWSKAKNLGYPINDAGNQGALVVSLDGRKGYFAGPKESAVEGDFFGGALDIFEFEMPKSIRPDAVTYVHATVLGESSNPLVAKIEVVDLATGKSFYSTLTDEKGQFLAVLPSGKNYALNVSKKDYIFHSENFALLESHVVTKPFELVIHLRKIKPSASTEKPKPIILHNVFFDSGSAILKSTSNFELDKVAELLKNTNSLVMQINGHTDNVGNDADNLRLSEQRAKSVYNYLVQKGVSISQLKYKGFGESRPIDTNDTDVGRSNNRRTEMEPLN